MIWLAILCSVLMDSDSCPEDWGFFGHKKINRHAVYSLPPEMFAFYRKHIEYISDHAVDPDKRRYATRHEGVRHYIDIDVWGDYPFDDLPRNFNDALIKYAKYYRLVDGDTIVYRATPTKDSITFSMGETEKTINYRAFRLAWDSIVMPQYYEDSWSMPLHHFGYGDSLSVMHIDDVFSPDGILPYHLSTMKHRLTNAFVAKDQAAILRLSTEIGHYIGDAHVPLHTTINYNGQLTDQLGIHGFWESRIPELYANDTYDFLVGKAEYISDTKAYFWDIVLASHKLVPDVLGKEVELRSRYRDDQIYCYDERLDRTIRTYCPEYAQAYQASLAGMVEKRMRATILAVANIWYTCWIDAGQPNLDQLDNSTITVEEIVPDATVKKQARVHE